MVILIVCFYWESYLGHDWKLYDQKYMNLQIFNLFSFVCLWIIYRSRRKNFIIERSIYDSYSLTKLYLLLMVFTWLVITDISVSMCLTQEIRWQRGTA